MEFTLYPHPPFHFDLTLQRYRLFGEDAAHVYIDGVYCRVIESDGKLWLYALQDAGVSAAPAVQVRLLGGEAAAHHRAAVEADIRHCLSLDLDLEPFYRWAQADPVLSELTQRCAGMRPPRASNLFEALVTSITAQQVNLAFATTIRSRLVKRYGKSLWVDGKPYYAFPTPEALADASLQDLRDMQFSWRKGEYIVNLAREVVDGSLRLGEFPQLSNAAIIERITQVKGLGRWTADWLLARGLGRGDVVAAGDLGVRKAVGKFYYGGQTPSIEAVRALTAPWGMFQNLAIHYLLAGLRMPDLPPHAAHPPPRRRRPA